MTDVAPTPSNSTPIPEELSRARGSLVGLALGDALGMPTQSLTREEIVARYGPVMECFVAPSSDHPYAAGLPAGTVTDDTEQALMLAELLIEQAGGFDARRFATRLLEWERDVERRGLLDLLGPSTKQAVLNIQAGMDPTRSGLGGTTNGAAMRIAPVGIICAGEDLDRLVERVIAVSEVTHNTHVALAAACAVAAAVAAGVAGAAVDDAIEVAVRAARAGERHGAETNDVPVSERLVSAVEAARAADRSRLADVLTESVGTSVAANESVPAAFGVLAAYADDPWGVCRVAAALGGDCDTIAAIAGAMAGACHGDESFPAWAIREVTERNDLHLDRVVRDLLALRR